jgi:hypothetical protein
MTSPGFTPVPTTTRPWRRASLSSILATTGERWVGQDSSSQVETTCSPHPRLDWICSVTDETEEPVHNTATEAPTPACVVDGGPHPPFQGRLTEHGAEGLAGEYGIGRS